MYKIYNYKDIYRNINDKWELIGFQEYIEEHPSWYNLDRSIKRYKGERISVWEAVNRKICSYALGFLS